MCAPVEAGREAWETFRVRSGVAMTTPAGRRDVSVKMAEAGSAGGD